MASSKNLTAKEELFTSLMISGEYSQRKAYREAFPHTVKWKDATVDVKASQLFNKDKVQIRYKELMRKHQDKAILTRDETLRGLRTAFMMALGVEPTKIVNISFGNLSEFSASKTNLSAVPGIVAQIAKLEGWEGKPVETTEQKLDKFFNELKDQIAGDDNGNK